MLLNALGIYSFIILAIMLYYVLAELKTKKADKIIGILMIAPMIIFVLATTLNSLV